MRISAGKYKNRELYFPRAIRPTQDKVRKAIFDVLGDISGFSVLDLFAGSGALGLEALSRDAMSAVFVEEDAAAFKMIKKNIEVFKVENSTRVVRDRVNDFLKKTTQNFDLIFADPPYEVGMSEIIRIIAMIGKILPPGGIFILEQGKRAVLPPETDDLKLIKLKKYGDTQVGFYCRKY